MSTRQAIVTPYEGQTLAQGARVLFFNPREGHQQGGNVQKVNRKTVDVFCVNNGLEMRVDLALVRSVVTWEG